MSEPEVNLHREWIIACVLALGVFVAAGIAGLAEDRDPLSALKNSLDSVAHVAYT